MPFTTRLETPLRSVPELDDTQRRTTALAYWRYGHEYLRAARMLSARHRVPCAECQPVYHLIAQAIEFALKAHLRASGVPASDVLALHTACLQRTLHECTSGRGLAAPGNVLEAIGRLDAHHTPEAFRAVRASIDAHLDLATLFDATDWLLEAAVSGVAEDYAIHYAEESSPSKDAFVQRLRADLSATRSEYAALA